MKLSILYSAFFLFVLALPTYGQTTYPTWSASPEATNSSTTVLLASALENFNLAKEGHTLQLSWSAFDVKKGDRFVVQQSKDGMNFENKARIEAEEDAWDQQFEIELGLGYGTQYYRIKVEGTGGIFYSEIKSIYHQEATLGYKVYPNPCQEYFVIEGQTNSKSYVQVLDLMGQVVYQQKFKGGEISHHVEHQLEAGLYSLRIVNDLAVSSKNIIVH